MVLSINAGGGWDRYNEMTAQERKRINNDRDARIGFEPFVDMLRKDFPKVFDHIETQNFVTAYQRYVDTFDTPEPETDTPDP